MPGASSPQGTEPVLTHCQVTKDKQIFHHHLPLRHLSRYKRTFWLVHLVSKPQTSKTFEGGRLLGRCWDSLEVVFHLSGLVCLGKVSWHHISFLEEKT